MDTDKEPELSAEIVLFFDMDGTLIHTNYANFLSYKEAIRSVTESDYNLTYDPDKRFNRSILKKAIPNLTEAQYQRIIIAKEVNYNNFLHETRLNKDIASILFKYSKKNRTILVTNCRKERALITLNYYNLTDRFTNIFCRESSSNEKKTNKFQTAISRLNVSPSLVIAFDNEETEITDAKLAGIQFINPTTI